MWNSLQMFKWNYLNYSREEFETHVKENKKGRKTL